jgi:hypothetical protein
MIVLEVLAQDGPQVLLSEDDDVVEAFPPKGPDHALAVRILPRGPRRGAHGGKTPYEALREKLS